MARPRIKHKRSHRAIELFDGLPLRKRRYVKERVSGKSKKDAALAAGYSESSAKNVAQVVETPDVREVFKRLLRKTIPPERIVRTI